MDPADVAAAVPSTGAHDAEDRVAGEEGGRGGERLLGPSHGVHLVNTPGDQSSMKGPHLEPGVGGKGLAARQTGQVHSPALCHPVNSTDSVWLAQTVS